MKQKSILLLSAFSLFSFVTTEAQNTSPFWSLAGSSNASASSKLGATNGNPLRFFTNNAERMRLDATNGRLGIGTANPQQRLHVEGPTLLNIFVSTSPLSNISGAGMIGYTKFLPTASGQRLGYFLLGSRGGAESNHNAAGMVGYAADAWSAGSSHPAYLAFETTPSGSNARQERMRIDQNGNVSIGTTSPAGALHVASSTAGYVTFSQSTFAGISDRVGVYASSINAPGYGYGAIVEGGWRGIVATAQTGDYTGSGYGVQGYGYGSQGTRYGVAGFAINSGGNTTGDFYGVYGSASGGGFNAAGYFDGDVYAVNYYIASDRKFKTDIKPLEGALEKIMKLKPSTYEFNTAKYPRMAPANGPQIGLIAEEVKEVFPELVKSAVQPAQYDKGGRKQISEAVAYESVNYQGLIPALIASVQEQQARIEKLESELAKIKGTTAVSLSSAWMDKIAPNPVKGASTIRYSVPDGSTAKLLITDATGRQIKAVQLKGAGTLNLDASTLASGIYHYSLVVDGKAVQTERVTVAR